MGLTARLFRPAGKEYNTCDAEPSTSCTNSQPLFLYDLVVYQKLHVMLLPLWTVVMEVIELIVHHLSIKVERLVTVDTPYCTPKGIGAHDLKGTMPACSEGSELSKLIDVGHFSLWLREWMNSEYALLDKDRSKYADSCII